MNFSKELKDLEIFFNSRPEFNVAVSQYLEAYIGSRAPRESADPSFEELPTNPPAKRLTFEQKNKLKAILFPANAQAVLQNLNTNPKEALSPKTGAIPKLQQAVHASASEEEKSESTETEKQKKIPSIAINTTRARGEMKLIRSLVEKHKSHHWKEATGLNGDIMWSGLDIPWEEIHIAKEIKLNRIPGMKSLAHKKMTGFYLNKFREYYPEEFDFYPRTFLIPEETEKFKEYMEGNPERLFIAKPTSGSQGDGITLVKKFSDLPISSCLGNEMVVQEYIDKPLLHDGKKFDSRLYLLISNVKPMLAFLNEEGLARFCTENYQPPTKENLRNSFMHLTNYSLNKLSPNYKYTEECVEINDGSKRTLTSLWKGLEKEGVKRDEIMENIKFLLQRLLVSLQPIIQFSYNAAFEGKDNGHCFHVLGIDVLIDEDLKPWLLEINSNPSLNIGHEDHADPKAKEIISLVDKFVKEKVVEDALLIMKKSANEQAELETYGTYEMIYNSKGGNFNEMELFKDILDIFEKLSGVRFKTHLASSKFRKLGTIAGMTNDKLVKAHYDIIYQKLVKNSEDNHMSFAEFIQAIEYITSILKKSEYDPNNKKVCIEQVVAIIKRGL